MEKGEGCWNWKGCILNNGSGQISFNGKKYYNLDVPANGQNFLLVEKGEYILTTMVCDAKYSSLKKINKDIEIELNLSE